MPSKFSLATVQKFALKWSLMKVQRGKTAHRQFLPYHEAEKKPYSVIKILTS